jgi:NO-binding membrane sensor protein with MHYT domain
MLGPVRACEGIVDYRGAGRATLCLAGAVTGLGVAAMHYLGMAAVQLNGSIRYDPPPVALSVLSSWRRRSVVVQSRTTRP